jgi:hypothetical protein
MGKVRVALDKPRLPFLVVVTKTDKIDVKKAEGARAQVERRISTALAGDVHDVHFVHNFTRTELQEEFTEIKNRASTTVCEAVAVIWLAQFGVSRMHVGELTPDADMLIIDAVRKGKERREEKLLV